MKILSFSFYFPLHQWFPNFSTVCPRIMCVALVKFHFFVPPFKLRTMFLIESMTEYHTVGTVGRTAVIHGVVKLRKCYSLALFLFLCIRQALPVPSFDISSYAGVYIGKHWSKYLLVLCRCSRSCHRAETQVVLRMRL